MRTCKLLLISAAIFVQAPNAFAEKEQTPNAGAAKEPAESAESASNTVAQRQFAGLNFGVGISLTHDLGKTDRVESASVVNGVVRVDNENNDIARIMLESHYFFTPKKQFRLNPNMAANQWGWGPFVALQPGTDEIIEAVALGVMWGFKRNDNPKDTSSWNIGIGAVVDPNVRVLGDGIEEGKPLPSGETEIRYKEKSQGGVLILTSFSF